MSQQRSALSKAFLEHRDALLRFLLRRLGSAALAEELAQETWLRATSMEGVAAIDNPRGYLFRIAANLSIDHNRRSGQGVEVEAGDAVLQAVPDPRPSPEIEAHHRAEYARLLAVVEALPPRCREVFVMARFDGLKYAEIAERLGISRNTVISHVVHALSVIEAALPPDPA
jgi:RNA polymerase sigma-70 factor (ECF subfamily)